MRQSLYDYCRLYHKQQLLEEWDAERNLPLTPQAVSHGSHTAVWWRCGNGHTWQTPVYARTAGAGCPYCTGRRVGQSNDFASLYPDLAAQWDTQKNAPRKPSGFPAGSHCLVWWVCEKGHSWRAQINSRVSGGCGCPVCAGRLVQPGENDLASQFPRLAKEWDIEKNGALTPEKVTARTNRRVWWRCSLGHSWQAAIAARTISGTSCPVCTGKQILPGFNDLASQYPELAREWDPERNGSLAPDSVSAYSNRKAWWRCEKNHSYQAVIASRTMRGSGCPYCANKKVLSGFNDLATAEPELAKQWHPTLNGSLTPQMVTAGSHRKAWWQCAEGHTWKALIYSRTGTQKCGCPICAGMGTRKSKRYREILGESTGKFSEIKGMGDIRA